MSSRAPTVPVFEPEYLEGFRQIYEEKIVFNQTLGLRTEMGGIVVERNLNPGQELRDRKSVV